MVSEYRPELWRDLYVMLGTSSAALIGLLFVVTSLRIDEFMDNQAFQIRARNITLHLLAMLVQAAAVLTPQPADVLGAELVAINLCGLWLPASFMYKAFYKNKEMGKRGGVSFYRATTYLSGYLLGIVGGVGLIKLSNWGMYLVTISCVNFIVSVIWNAWKIMFGIGQTGKVKNPK
jgi:hypothetical protein